MWVSPDQLDMFVVVDPIRAMQCRRGETGHDTATTRPQPRRFRTLPKRRE
jgi:hypothetical protein